MKGHSAPFLFWPKHSPLTNDPGRPVGLVVDGDDEDGDNGDYIVDIDDDDADVDSYVVDNDDGDDDDCSGEH